jgi:co-chaperonin GroES (HSP10)
MNIQALGRKVVVRLPKPPTKTESGIIIPDNAKPELDSIGSFTTTVLSVGEKVDTVQVGDTVVLNPHGYSLPLKYMDGTEVLVLNVDELIGILK